MPTELKTSTAIKYNNLRQFYRKNISKKKAIIKFRKTSDMKYSKSLNLKKKPFSVNDTIQFTELVNARCAILGLVSGKGFEYITNESIQTQSVDYYAYIILSGLIVSLCTYVVGKPDPTGYSKRIPFAVESELTSGRLSMLLYAFYFYTGI